MKNLIAIDSDSEQPEKSQPVVILDDDSGIDDQQ